MSIAYQRRLFVEPGLVAHGNAYDERADWKDNRFDRMLMSVWGRASPYVASTLSGGRLERFVRTVFTFEKTIKTSSDAQLRRSTDGLRMRLLGARRDSDAVAFAFAAAREAARRHTGMCHFPVQVLGGAAMMNGALAEMQTGEGKSLTAILPAVAAALTGRAVHIITVNDYLARRDAEQFRKVYAALGLTVGLIEQGQQPRDRQQAYNCDVTYCTNKELVFDYLRDRLALGARGARTRFLVDRVFRQGTPGSHPMLALRGLHFAVVDEADSVLIDEARTPLILSGSEGDGGNDAEHYEVALDIAKRLALGEDFHLRANQRFVRLTSHGERRLADLTRGMPGLWAIRQAREELVQQALSAQYLFRRDVQYIVKDSKVQIVDEYTGRVMADRSWEFGLHQLIEAKENCAITVRRHTLARMTYQRFFRRYVHLCGMTGTALETAGELRAIYGLSVMRIPTNRPLQRRNLGTRFYRDADLKWNAVVESAKAAADKGRAVLIGTRSVNASEHVASLLQRAGLLPFVLNARQDRREAEIVATAGEPGRITVATNMAGRGTDIKPHSTVRDAGGLHVILSEFHESSRIDRQLFGRAGRQGDPGSHESIVALDDELFRRFGRAGLLLLSATGLKHQVNINPAIGHFLRTVSQRSAERVHGRARRATLSEDQRLSKLLGFAGTE
jgi:preprotein translocase subunit SecA